MALPNFRQLNTANSRAMLRDVRRQGLGNLGIPLLMVMLLGMMIMPIPTFVLDALFTFNIALSMVVLLVGVYAMRPLDFQAFPTILLLATLLRLADRKSTRLNSSHV